MTGGEVERVEVVPGRLDLATVDDAVAEPEEDVLDLAPDLGDQVEPAARVAADGSVTSTRSSLRRRSSSARESSASRASTADSIALAHRVEAHAGLAVAHLAQRELELALATEVLDPHPLDLVGRARRGDRSEGRLLERLDVHRTRGYLDGFGPSTSYSDVVGELRRLCADLRPLGGAMTEDVDFYVGLAARLRGRSSSSRWAPVGSRCRSAERTGRRVIGIDVVARDARARRGRRPTDAGVEVDLRRGRHAASSRSTSRPTSSYCPFRAHAASADATKRGSRSWAASRRRSCRAGASPGTRSSSTRRSRPRSTASGGRERRFATAATYDEADNRIDVDAGGRRVGVTSGGWPAPSGRRDRRRAGLEVEALYGWFDRRPFDDASAEFVWVARKPMAVSGALYDRIARIYDPWSASVTEDVEFYVEEAVASGGPVVELAVGTGRIAVPIARAGVAVIGVDESPEMLAVARAYAEREGVSELARPAPRRPPRAAGRGARAARHDPVPLAPPHAGREREAPRAARCRRAARARGAPRLRRLRAEPTRTSRRPTASGSSASAASSSAPTGTSVPARSSSRCGATSTRRRWSCTGSRHPSGTR